MNALPHNIQLNCTCHTIVYSCHFLCCDDAQVRSCSTFYQTMIMLFQVFLGKFDFEEL